MHWTLTLFGHLVETYWPIWTALLSVGLAYLLLTRPK